MENPFFTDPVTVSLHHHVLLPWAELRRLLPTPPQVISLDFHTDTLSAARRGLAIPAGAWQDAGLLRDAVQTLHHDEHFNWALRTGLISRADIIAISPQVGEYGHPAMQVHPLAPEMTPETVLQSPETIRHTADHALELLPEIQVSDPFILDIDCDFFLTANACSLPPDSLFAQWVRRAAMITLSREGDWVKLLQLPGEKLSGNFIAQHLAGQCLLFR